MNESIYYNVDTLSGAITDGKKITFRYFEWRIGGGRMAKSLRRQGGRYTVDPLALCWAEENYYLVGFDSDDRRVKHFRVDKMQDIEAPGAPREDGQDGFDVAEYSARMFGMFGGEVQRVKLLFSNRLAGVVADRFGSDVFLTEEGEHSFAATVDVAVSPQFLSWVIGFGKEARVLHPPEVAEKVREMAHDAIEDSLSKTEVF